MPDRYIRQETFKFIGKEGQEKLRNSRVAVIGLGSVGSMTANLLARSGVGFLRLIDRDFVDITNLQRQMLYTEEDVQKEIPKADALLAHLKAANSENEYEAVVADANSSTIDSMITDVDLVIDGSDSFDTRFLMGEACVNAGKSWIYAGLRGSIGMLKNFIYGEEEPCLRCMINYESVKNAPPCSTDGFLSAVSVMLASVQANEAVKILTGSDSVIKDMLYLDLWSNSSRLMPVVKNPDCPVCGKHEYSYYGKLEGLQASELCGRDAVQIVPPVEKNIDFVSFGKKLEPFGTVKAGKFTLDFSDGNVEIRLFKNGRAIMNHISDKNRAKSLYTKYIEI